MNAVYDFVNQHFFYFAFSGFCAAHFSIIWKKTEASSGW